MCGEFCNAWTTSCTVALCSDALVSGGADLGSAELTDSSSVPAMSECRHNLPGVFFASYCSLLVLHLSPHFPSSSPQ